jgi:hypothetical protein
MESPHSAYSRGASGFVQLAQNQETRERVAIKCVRTHRLMWHRSERATSGVSIAAVRVVLLLMCGDPVPDLPCLAAAQVHPPRRAQQGGAVPGAAAPQRVRPAPQHRAAQGAALLSGDHGATCSLGSAWVPSTHLAPIRQLILTPAYMPGLPRLQEVFLTPHHLGIAMEYVDGGDLAQWVQMHRIPDVSAGTS